MPLSVVLYNPVIPPNTGNVARLTAALGCSLYLIEPLGFELSDRYLKRAGLDYWPEVRLATHADWESFIKASGAATDELWFLTTKVERPYYEPAFGPDDFLVFGSETVGLPSEIHERYADRRLTIPQLNKNVRSLNLSSSVAMVLGEAVRQQQVRAGTG